MGKGWCPALREGGVRDGQRRQRDPLEEDGPNAVVWAHRGQTHSSAGMDPEGDTDMYSGSTAGLEEVPPPLHLIWPISPAYGRSSLFHSLTQSPDWARWTRE